jgi:hypothetical protein
MQVINIVVLTISLAVSSLTFAEGGGDRAFERMETAREVAMANRKPVSDVKEQQDIVQEKPISDMRMHDC